MRHSETSSSPLLRFALVALAAGGASLYAQGAPPQRPPERTQGPEQRTQGPEQNPPAEGWRRFEEREQPMAPPQLVVPAGTWITVRVNEPLSSDDNQQGDVFSATLAQPLVADGFVVARRGQTVAGRVSEAVRAGRSKGTSRLAIELIEVSLVDGQRMQLQTQLIQSAGGTSTGNDVAAVATGAGVGAAIGAAADGGFGAGMGAIAGGAASVIGVMLTRGRPTVVYPESTLTFRTQEALTISTERGLQAFHPVEQQDYEPERQLQRRPVQRRGPAYGPYPYYGPYWGGWGPYYGPGFSFFYSRPYYYRGGVYRGGGYRRR